MSLIELTRRCFSAIPGAPEELVNAHRRDSYVLAECKDGNGNRYDLRAAWRRPNGTSSRTGFAVCLLTISRQQWVFRLCQVDGSIYPLSVSAKRGEPHFLTLCWYEMSGAHSGTCSLCGTKNVRVKQGQFGGSALEHVWRCDTCQPLPCGAPTAPFNKELALSH